MTEPQSTHGNPSSDNGRGTDRPAPPSVGDLGRDIWRSWRKAPWWRPTTGFRDLNEEAGERNARIQGAAGSAVSRARAQMREVLSDTPAPQETFDQAMQRLGLSLQDVAEKRRAIARASRTYYIVGVAVLFLSAWQINASWVLIPISTVLLGAMGVSQGFLYAWRVYQIDQRRFVGTFREFVRDPGAWLV